MFRRTIYSGNNTLSIGEAMAITRRDVCTIVPALLPLVTTAKLFAAADLLSEDVDRRRLALLVQPLDDAAGVRKVGARDVALRDLADDRPGDGRKNPDDGAIEESQGPGDCNWAHT